MSGIALLFLSTMFVMGLTVGVGVYIYYGRLYMRARVLNAEIPLARMFALTANRVSAYRVITAYLDARQAGTDVPLDRFEAHARAGGDPICVSRRLQRAKRDGEHLSPDAAFSECETDGEPAARVPGAA
jgi:uncharacterized protein YqfA (UPF0365 family)